MSETTPNLGLFKYDTNTDSDLAFNIDTGLNANWDILDENVGNIYGKITNCITEIPQDIKLELNNDALILKAGSKVYVPNGFESDGTTPKFNEIIVESDINVSTFGTSVNDILMIYTPTGQIWGRRQSNQCFSGATAPTSGQYMLWYDTANNLVKSTSDSGSTWTSGFSLPIGCSTSDGTKYTSINQVFNGFGYIGSHAFAIPGVKGLVPNGRNEDGTLKNIEITLSRVWTTDGYTAPYLINGSGKLLACYYANYAAQDTQPSFSNGEWYNTSTNEWYRIENNVPRLSPSFIVGNAVVSNSKVTAFTPKRPLHLVNYSDLTDCHVVIETYQNGTSWYRVWSDGWCEQGGRGTITTSGSGTITFLKPFANTNYSLSLTKTSSDSSTWTVMTYIPSNTNTTAVIKANLTGYTLTVPWQASGYII